MGSKEQGSEKDQFIPVVRSSLSVFTVLSKPEAEGAASQKPPPASDLGFSLAGSCGGPGAVRESSGTGLGQQRAARMRRPQPHRYRHRNGPDDLCNVPQDRAGLTIRPFPSFGTRGFLLPDSSPSTASCPSVHHPRLA